MHVCCLSSVTCETCYCRLELPMILPQVKASSLWRHRLRAQRLHLNHAETNGQKSCANDTGRNFTCDHVTGGPGHFGRHSPERRYEKSFIFSPFSQLLVTRSRFLSQARDRTSQLRIELNGQVGRYRWRRRSRCKPVAIHTSRVPLYHLQETRWSCVLLQNKSLSQCGHKVPNVFCI